ncbi:hypothetical protein F5Y03DRAFT_396850 [Xylaria venustula]|nr:hypothetical protein F5Y03DRAFT_396850 [Xylaria venustula]
MDQKDVFKMVLTSVRSPISAFRRSLSLSAVSSQHHFAGERIEEMAVANRYDERDHGTLHTGSEVTTATDLLDLREQAGVRWRYAEQGRAIHHLAYMNREDPSFLRKSYIDGVAYMLLALPPDLEPHEAATIRMSLPACMQEAHNDDHRALGPRRSSPEGTSSTLQRFVAMMVAILIVVIHMLISYATLLVTLGAHYERKHNISQQIVSRGFVIASTVGRHGVELSGRICAMKDGLVGKAVGSIAIRTIESVASGIQEGIGQGLLMIDTAPRPG